MTMTSTSQPAPHGLPKLGIAVLMTFLMILGAVLMHTLMGHTDHGSAMPAMGSTVSTSHDMADDHHHASAVEAPGQHVAVSSVAAATPTLSAGVSDCGGLCAMICSLMGMACLMVLVLFAVAWLRGRMNRALFVVSKALAMTAVWARGVIPRRPVSLTALSIIRI
jgi:hypothetical protein